MRITHMRLYNTTELSRRSADFRCTSVRTKNYDMYYIYTVRIYIYTYLHDITPSQPL